MKRVYVAGKYNDDTVVKVLRNMRKGIDLCRQVIEAGHSPFCPWLDFQYGLSFELTGAQYLELSVAWLRASECVLLVDNWEQSSRAKKEIEIANDLGLLVYTELSDLVHGIPNPPPPNQPK